MYNNALCTIPNLHNFSMISRGRSKFLIQNARMAGKIVPGNWTFSDFLSSASSLTLFPRRSYGISRRKENSLIVGGLALFTAAVAIQYGIQIYNTVSAAKSQTDGSEPTAEKNTEAGSSGSSGSSFSFDMSSWFARNFYEGGFEDKMSKREAALILGVRESASIERIKDAHRRILLLNHPDRGGSAYVAAKINEAKDLLMKGKST